MDRRSVMTLLTLLLLVGILIGVWRSLSNFAMIPPKAYTRLHMTLLQRTIDDYARTHGALPTALSDLPPDTIARNLNDAWHHPLLYRLNPDGSATLTSLGADNAPGGTGENADITLDIPAPTSRPTTSP